MATKFLVLAVLVAVASAAAVNDHAATSHSSITHHHVQAHHAYQAPAVHHVQAHHGYGAPALHHAAPAVHYAAPVHQVIAAPIHKHIVQEEHHAPAHYEFEYSVHDPHTGDIKSQKESREGDAVHGSYSLIEADGSKRTVEYTADKHSGFNAIVHREHSQHPVAHKHVAPVAVKAIHAAPVYHHAAPVYHHAAPVYHHAAPVHHHAASVASYHHAAPAAAHSYISHDAPIHHHY